MPIPFLSRLRRREPLPHAGEDITDVCADLKAKRHTALQGTVFLVGLVGALICLIVFLALKDSNPDAAVISVSVASSIIASIFFTGMDIALSRRSADEYNRALANCILKTLRTQTDEWQKGFKGIQEEVNARLAWLQLLGDPASNANRLGLTMVYSDGGSADCREAQRTLVRKAKNLTVVVNSSHDLWVWDHVTDLLQNRIQQHKPTTIIVPSPKSPAYAWLATKLDRTQAQFEKDEMRFLQNLLELRQSSRIGQAARTGWIKVIGSPYYHPYLLILGDDRAIISPNYSASDSLNHPAFLYMRDIPTTFYDQLRRDVERCTMLDRSSGPLKSVDLIPDLIASTSPVHQ